MRVIASSNRKGGVGKTSSVFHLGGAFAERGLRVLWVDLDPQGNLTQIVYPDDEEFNRMPDNVSAMALLANDPYVPERLLHKTALPGISLLPASPNMARLNLPTNFDPARYEMCLAEFLAQVEDDFDVCLIDTPPNLQALTWAGIGAAQYVFTPTQPEDFGRSGIVPVRRFIESMKSGRNPNLEWLGIVLTKVQPRFAIHKLFTSIMTQEYERLCFAARLPYAVAFLEAVTDRQPVTHYDSGSAAAASVRALAVELALRAGFCLPELIERKAA